MISTPPSPVSRALIVAPTPFFGDRGCHVRIYEEVRALAALGVEAVIVTYPQGNDPPGLDVRRARRIPGARAGALGPSWGRPLLDAALVARARQVAREFRPQILHAHLHEGILVGALVRRAIGVPLVADLQGSLTAELVDHHFVRADGPAARVFRRVEDWLVRRPDAVLVSSVAGTSMLAGQGVPADRVHPLPDGVDTDRFRPVERDPALLDRLGLRDRRIVVFLGVLTRYQGVDTLLDAVPHVVGEIPDAHFLVMGYPNVERYRALVQARALQPWVTLPGRVPYAEASRWLALGDVAVSAKESATEANGKLLNYMACALPVVASDTPVNRELLGDLGVFAPVGDPAGLAARLVDLLRDGPRARERGAALRRRAEAQFSWAALGRRLLAVYNRLARPAAAALLLAMVAPLA